MSVFGSRRLGWVMREPAGTKKWPAVGFAGIDAGANSATSVSARIDECFSVMDSLAGQLLIATPALLDPNFAQTVVLIASHDEEGALGLILNRELTTRLPQVWEQVSQSPCLRDELVRQGGPISGTLLAVHDQRALANLVVNEDLNVATELSAMEVLAASDEGRVVFFVGHSGWGPGQLESELREGSWILLPARPEHVFESQDALTFWKDAITEAGRRQVHSVIPLRHIPEDPRLN